MDFKLFIRFLVLLLSFFIISCSSNNNEHSLSKADHLANFSSPKIILASKPAIVNLDRVPSPEIILMPTEPTNKTRAVMGEQIVKLYPPEKKQADFFANIQNFNTEQGLPLGTINCSYRDKAGNLWFGTEGGGVSKYDGKSFVNFTTEQGLVSNVIWCIIEDKIGNFWFGTSSGGVSKYDGKTFTNFTPKNGLTDNTILMQEIESYVKIPISSRSQLRPHFLPHSAFLCSLIFSHFCAP